MITPGSPTPPPRRRALLLACDRYDDPELPPLRSPSRDADALGKVLSDAGYEVTKVANCSAGEAQRSIAVHLGGAGRTDINLIYLSCHGIRDRDGNLYFAFEDSLESLPDATAVAADFVRRRIGSGDSRTTILLLDCCFSGAFLRGMRAKSSSGAGVDALVRDLPESNGVAVLASSGATQFSFEAAQRGSYFTEALLAGMATGAADRDNDGRITVDELFAYVSARVADGPSTQKPCKLVHSVGELVVAKVGLRLHAPPPPAPPPVVADTMLIDRVTLPPWPPLPPAPAFRHAPAAPPTIAPRRAPVPTVYGRRRHTRRRLHTLVAAGTLTALTGILSAVELREPDTVQVPTLIGLDRSAAVEQLHDAGLGSGEMSMPTGGTAKTCTGETVIGQDPGPASDAVRGSLIRYAVCPPVKVPDVLDQSWTSAKSELAKARLRIEKESAGGCRRDRVTSQEPEPGEKVPRDSTVTVTMCTGSEQSSSGPTTHPPNESPVVPCVTGFEMDRATAAVERKNLNVSVSFAEEQGTPGTVLTQSPPCGTRAKPGSTVTLTVLQQTSTPPTQPNPPDGPQQNP